MTGISFFHFQASVRKKERNKVCKKKIFHCYIIRVGHRLCFIKITLNFRNILIKKGCQKSKYKIICHVISQSSLGTEKYGRKSYRGERSLGRLGVLLHSSNNCIGIQQYLTAIRRWRSFGRQLTTPGLAYCAHMGTRLVV